MRTSTNVSLSAQGIDAGKKIVGGKRGIITDTLGLLLAAIVTAASASDNTIDMDLLDRATATYPTSPRPGSTWASRTASSNTVPPSASTSGSSRKTHRSRASVWSNADGSSSGCAVRR
ncbi:hypothetical protein ACWCHM_21730 [Micromonospora sp. SCSIO 07396]